MASFLPDPSQWSLFLLTTYPSKDLYIENSFGLLLM
ncbi:unnamed protein product, partial [Larinioides sclopetarius]